MREFVKSIARDEKGLESVEYAIVMGLIIAATIAAITALGNAVSTKFNNMANTVQAAGS
jgi:Flp pilus assembly pilin Flp